MSPKTTMFLPRNLGGVIARLAPTPDGGAEVVAWDKGAWRAAPFSVREVATAPVASDARLAELGIPNPATPAQEPFEEQKAGDPAMFHTLSTFVPRDLGGVIVRLAYARGGKLDDLEVLAWEGDAWHRRDIPISDALAAPAASDDHLLDIGYPEPEEEALQPFFRLLVKLEAGRRVIERMHTRAAIAKAERGEPLTPSEIALLPRDKHPAGFTDLEAAEDRAIAKLAKELEERRRRERELEANAPAARRRDRTPAEIDQLLNTFTDPEEAEDRAIARAFARLRARRRQRELEERRRRREIETAANAASADDGSRLTPAEIALLRQDKQQSVQRMMRNLERRPQLPKQGTDEGIRDLPETSTDPAIAEDRMFERLFKRLAARRKARPKPANDA